MRQEAADWFQDAHDDLAAARKMAQSEDFNWAVFAARQAVEKALKGAHIVLQREDPPSIHSLPKLFELNFGEVPDDLAEDLRSLSRQYMTTRYPDVAGGPTAEAYSQASAESALAQAERLLTWISQNLPSTNS
jgi:HEPN domain-containing protein